MPRRPQYPTAGLFPAQFANFVQADCRRRDRGLDPDDVLSDVVIAVLTSNLERPVRGRRLLWLYLDVLRRHARQGRPIGPLLATLQPAAPVEPPLDVIRFLLTLDAESHQLALLVWLAGLTCAQAAAQIGTSRAGAHRRLVRLQAQARCVAFGLNRD